jgi:hypothetical protein
MVQVQFPVAVKVDVVRPDVVEIVGAQVSA